MTGNSTRSRRLPPYQALFAVDIKDFSGFESAAHAEVTARIRPIVAAVFRRCGLGAVWDDELWHRTIGDAPDAGASAAQRAPSPARTRESEGSCPSRVDTHRLLDSFEVKQALARAGDATCLAAIVSERAFTDAVLGGYCELTSDRFTPVDVAVKTIGSVPGSRFRSHRVTCWPAAFSRSLRGVRRATRRALKGVRDPVILGRTLFVTLE